jgi:hypothetical protein
VIGISGNAIDKILFDRTKRINGHTGPTLVVEFQSNFGCGRSTFGCGITKQAAILTNGDVTVSFSKIED